MNPQRSTQTDTSAALVPAIILFGGMTLLLIGLLASRPNVVPAKTGEAAASSVTAPAVESPVAAEATEAGQAVAVALDPAKVKAGENNFQATCSACHGFNAMGIPGLGKSLIGSEFVNSQTDDQLLAFLQVGREVTDPLNTTGVAMPARGGNPTFTDDKLIEIIAYIRSLNLAPSQPVSGAAPTTQAPTSSAPFATEVPSEFALPDLSGLAVPTTLAGDSSGIESTAAPTEVPATAVESTSEPTEISTAPTASAAYTTMGESLYVQSCSGCHAVDGSGVEYVAKSLTESQLLQAKNGIGLLNFLIDGDANMNPPHPYRGGYPELSNEDLLSIIGYLYSLPTAN